MSVLPETSTKKARRRWPGYALAVVGLAALLLAAVALLQDRGFSPGEELYAQELEDVAVSAEDTSYPPSDVLRLDRRPEVVYVERSGRQSALSWLLGGGGGIEAVGGQEEQLGPSGGGVAGVVKFAVREESGEPLPAGNYTVSIYAGPEGTEDKDLAATKYFVIRD